MSILEVKSLTKIFPGTVALNDVSVSFESGRVHALVGKNGSGKSTMLKILSGSQKATSGSFYLDGEEMHFSSTADAFSKGIATVYQELSLVPGLSVAENIFLGRMPKKRGIIDYRRARKEARELLSELDIDIDADLPVSSLSMWQRQMVEIAKAMSFNPRVLQLDEPTSSLAKHEVESLFRIVRSLREKDVIVIYVSHKLQELWEIADTCTVIRDGEFVGRVEMKSTTRAGLVSMMFGDVQIQDRPKDLMVSDEVVLSVRNLTRKGKFTDVSFDLHRGEVLGIAGMLGSGRTELLKSVFGADPFDSGKIFFAGREMHSPSLIRMKKLGMALTPEDRKHEGLILEDSVASNLCYASLRELSPNGFMKKSREREFVDRQVEALQIKVASPRVSVGSLSGGNQQKVVVGNWLNTHPTVMFFDEPSRGIDVNAKQQIFRIMWDQSRKGVASVMVSTELEELFEVCQRILIMRDGRLIGEAYPEELTVNGLYAMCMGEGEPPRPVGSGGKVKTERQN